jgi:hypothetical protein
MEVIQPGHGVGGLLLAERLRLIKNSMYFQTTVRFFATLNAHDLEGSAVPKRRERHMINATGMGKVVCKEVSGDVKGRAPDARWVEA